MERLTKVQMQYLLTWLQQEGKNRSFGFLSYSFGITKSTIHKAMNTIVERGYLARDYQLTEKGREYLEWYMPRHQALENWLVLRGIGKETAGETAYIWMSATDLAVIEMLVNNCVVCSVCSCMIPNGKSDINLDGVDLSSCLPAGIYNINIEMKKAGNPAEFSMADKAFEKPARLVVSEGGSYIQLTRLRIMHLSVNGRDLVTGKMRSLTYINSEGQKMKAGLEGDRISIPTKDIRWYCSKKELVLRGQLKVFLTCTAGMAHMPKMPAVLQVTIVQDLGQLPESMKIG